MRALGERQDAGAFERHMPVAGKRQPPERRKRLRIATHYPARVRWLEDGGGTIWDDAVLDNLSSNGLYMRMPQQLVSGHKVFVTFRMSDPAPATRGPRLAVRGSVLRTELLDDGSWGVVVVFKQHRFL